MQVYIIGCGGNAKVITDICELNKYEIMGFFDDKYNNEKKIIYRGHKIIGKISDICNYGGINIINSIGDCKIRKKIVTLLENNKLNWINCVHPNSYITSTVDIGIGNVICYGAVINSDTKIGNFNLINTNAIIEHDCYIGDFNHIAPKSTVCGGITIGDTNLLGAGTTIIPGIKIGNNNIIGAMSAIIRNIDNNSVVIGIPGKIIKQTT
jgi:acetyltransferase EpsM